ncbi:hypothetical protein FKM82_019056 [Ascaphus truei]
MKLEDIITVYKSCLISIKCFVFQGGYVVYIFNLLANCFHIILATVFYMHSFPDLQIVPISETCFACLFFQSLTAMRLLFG